MPTPLGPPQVPRHGPTVGSYLVCVQLVVDAGLERLDLFDGPLELLNFEDYASEFAARKVLMSIDRR
jgi:hypothetical protein